MNRLRTPERPNLEIAFWDLKQNAVIDAICLWFQTSFVSLFQFPPDFGEQRSNCERRPVYYYLEVEAYLSPAS